MSEWLYQIRIKVSEKLSTDLRGSKSSPLAIEIDKIAHNHSAKLVCTFDAFADYCEEAEKNGIEHYELYHWTKSTIENPEKKSKHLKSFAFYEGDNQVYNKELAVSIQQSLNRLESGNDIVEINLIDSKPANNPQPPKPTNC